MKRFHVSLAAANSQQEARAAKGGKGGKGSRGSKISTEPELGDAEKNEIHSHMAQVKLSLKDVSKALEQGNIKDALLSANTLNTWATSVRNKLQKALGPQEAPTAPRRMGGKGGKGGKAGWGPNPDGPGHQF